MLRREVLRRNDDHRSLGTHTWADFLDLDYVLRSAEAVCQHRLAWVRTAIDEIFPTALFLSGGALKVGQGCVRRLR